MTLISSSTRSRDLPSASAPMEPGQYSLSKILVLWLLAALPMALVTWVLLPVLVLRIRQAPILLYSSLLIAAMVWQFAVSLWLVRREEGNLSWATLRRRTWLNAPRDPKTSRPRGRLFWWLLPFVLISGLALGIGVFAGSFAPPLLRLVNPSATFSFLDTLSYLSVLQWASPEFAGQWWLLGIALLVGLLSSLLGEEFFFRGILLPRMAGTFGERDWLANAALFGLYHLDKPWMIPLRFIEALAIVIPARYFRSNWMAVSVRALEGLFLFVVVLCGITAPTPPPLPATLGLPHIETRPSPLLYSRGAAPRSLPSFDLNSSQSFQVDLRSYDLSALDLREEANTLLYADFDTRTRWPSPDRMPPDLNPAQVLELGKNPGLGVRRLHARGITGRGVGVGIIDQPLLTEHQEYADQLRWYEELGRSDELPKSWFKSAASMHGPAVASIAVGKTVGVAPEADLYYIGIADYDTTKQYAYFAQGVRRLLKINDSLPAGRKIRVISMSLGWNPTRPGYNDITSAVREANARGILTVYTTKSREDGMGYQGLGRSPLADPDAFTSYQAGLFWALSLSRGNYSLQQAILAPMDARTTAAPGGPDDYAFYRMGGMSWPTPYIAGVYALAAQVEPSITPDRFWALALETGRRIPISLEGRTLMLDSAIDPGALIAAIQK